MQQNWFIGIISDSMVSILLSMIDTFSSLINNIFNIIYDINVGLKFDILLNYASSLAMAFVVLFAIKQGIDVYVFQTEGDPDADPLELITRSAITVTTIYCGGYVLEQLIKVAGMISEEVQGKMLSIGAEKNFTEFYKNQLNEFHYGAIYKQKVIGFVMIILMLFILIAIIIFIFHAAKRGAELIMFKLMLPVMATDLLTTNKEKWKGFLSELIICVFGYILQVAAFNVFLIIFAKSVNDMNHAVNYMIASLGWLAVVISTPKWLGKFMYSSGIGNGVKGGARTAVFMIPQIKR